MTVNEPATSSTLSTIPGPVRDEFVSTVPLMGPGCPPDGLTDRGHDCACPQPISRAAQRVVMGPRLLQPVVLGHDSGRRPAVGPAGVRLRGGRSFCLEDQLPRPAPPCAGSSLLLLSRPAHVAHHA